MTNETERGAEAESADVIGMAGRQAQNIQEKAGEGIEDLGPRMPATSRRANDGGLYSLALVASVVASMALFGRKRRLPFFGWTPGGWTRGRMLPLLVLGLVMMFRQRRPQVASSTLPQDQSGELVME
jgi:hypothetical protein